ncbi:MAG: CHAP domain-containing protein, partial [Acidimicrobiaceae bacterium]|nr:CHAP domain-containing protein [Acidimicrobiaceae bacterium]
TGNIKLNSPITGMAPTKDGRGYWLVAADGGIFSFGDARFYGSLGADTNLPAGIVGMAPTPDGKGYLLVGNGGGVYAFGDAVYRGQSSAIQPTEVITGIATTPDGLGYWLLEPDAFPVAFNHPGPTSALEARIVSIATSQVHGNPDYKRSFCNPYGPCEEWCALFATWVWDTAGIPIPRYAFVGNVFDWAAAHTGVFGAKVKAQPGDFVLYGTGPQTVATAVHMAVVTQVWPDGAIDTVDGDSGPAPYGHFNVTLNGPFLPSNSAVYNGFPIFAFARP